MKTVNKSEEFEKVFTLHSSLSVLHEKNLIFGAFVLEFLLSIIKKKDYLCLFICSWCYFLSIWNQKKKTKREKNLIFPRIFVPMLYDKLAEKSCIVIVV